MQITSHQRPCCSLSASDSLHVSLMHAWSVSDYLTTSYRLEIILRRIILLRIYLFVVVEDMQKGG